MDNQNLTFSARKIKTLQGANTASDILIVNNGILHYNGRQEDPSETKLTAKCNDRNSTNTSSESSKASEGLNKKDLTATSEREEKDSVRQDGRYSRNKQSRERNSKRKISPPWKKGEKSFTEREEKDSVRQDGRDARNKQSREWNSKRKISPPWKKGEKSFTEREEKDSVRQDGRDARNKQSREWNSKTQQKRKINPHDSERGLRIKDKDPIEKNGTETSNGRKETPRKPINNWFRDFIVARKKGRLERETESSSESENSD